tara:strand:- start:2451 stop:3830 length:1380 start_codon:yes stop_codon:yes gene_type:complete
MAKNLGASGVLYTDRRDFYIDPQVVKELWTDVAPFTTVISNKETRQTNDPLFKMFEHRNPWVKQSITLGVCAGGTASLAVPDNDTGIKLGNALNPATPLLANGIAGLEGEGVAAPTLSDSMIGLIVDVHGATGTHIGVGVIAKHGTTGFMIKNMTGTSWSLPTATGTVLSVIGNAQGEGSYSPDAWADELSTVYNSTQIFKTPLEVTGTLLQAALRGESSELARLREMKNQEHKMQKEKAFLFGTRVGGTGMSTGTFGDGSGVAGGNRTDINGKAIRSTYGIVSSLEKYGNATASSDAQNVFTCNVSVANGYGFNEFVDDMEKVFQYVPTSGVKRAFCGAGALGEWNKVSAAAGTYGANSGWTVNLGDMKRDALGFNYRSLETPHGMLQLIPTPALRGNYNKHMVIVDDDNLFHAQYRSPMYQTNIKSDNGYDGVKDQYMSDEGVGISLIESHSLFKLT